MLRVRSSTRRMSRRMCRSSGRRVLHRLRLLFLLLFVFFLLCAVSASRERNTANCNNKYPHKIFPLAFLDFWRSVFIQRWSDLLRMLPLRQTGGFWLSPPLFGAAAAPPQTIRWQPLLPDSDSASRASE